ncbi:hypothetical protein NQ315_007040 [Exocentrus adspersus]|uniref:Gustatory receptor n=1 Tax=Exocentrus adspersus TaxID=1586481 RepID=A0AAV8WCB4_9CUCU|nr:hypothetical protein NQ315_007040 [Exocentrus adspersus]
MALYIVDDPSEKHLHKQNKFDAYKQAFLENRNPDIKILLNLIGCYKFFLITPMSLGEGTIPRFAKYLSVFISAMCVVNCFFSISLFYGQTKEAPVTLFMVGLLFRVMGMLFLVFTVLNANVLKQENWIITLKSLNQAESIFRKLGFETTKKRFRLVAELAFVFVPFLILKTLQIYIYSHIGDLRFLCIHGGGIITDLYISFFIFFMMRLNAVLTSRYSFMDTDLKMTVVEQLKDQQKVRRLEDIIILYKTLKTLVDRLNMIFGAHLFFYVCYIVTSLLLTFSFRININSLDRDLMNLSIWRICSSVINIIWLTVFVMSCNSVETSGAKLTKTCYMLHEGCNSQLVKEQLMQLAEYVEQWKPNLSAAGFYNVNQSTLSAVFEAIITYLVIIIQFNLALEETAKAQT